MYQCEQCKKEFVSVLDLRYLIKSMNDKVKWYLCTKKCADKFIKNLGD